MQHERPRNPTPPRQVAVKRGRLVASILLGVVLVNPARAAAAELECHTFVPEAGATGVSTWGGYDVWILEFDGGQARFDAPGEGVWLEAGTEVDRIHKCQVSGPALEPTEEPAPEEPALEPTEEPAPEEPAPEPSQEPAPEEPTVEPAPEAHDEPAPEPTREPAPEEPTPEPVPEVSVEGGEPPTSDQSTPAPMAAPTPEPSPAPIILRSPPAPRTAPAEPEASGRDGTIRPTAPARVGDAEVLGTQLARTGAGRAMTLAAIGAALVVGGGACLGVSGRLARQR